MGKIKEAKYVKVFCGLIYRDEELVGKVKEFLEKKWGRVDFEVGPFPFNFTDYYQEEMGKDLKRRFFSFENLVFPENVWEWKIYTNKIEEIFSENGKRKVNIDPGYIDFSKVVLLSTKDFYHRIYIGKGIYAEVTLYFQKGDFRDFPWTYPDYKTENYINFFRKIREIYKKSIK